MTLRRWNLFLVVLTVGFVVAACGGGSGEASTTIQATTTTVRPTSTTASMGTTTSSSVDSPPVSLEGEVNDHGTASVSGESIEIEQDDFYFEPTFVEAEPGSTVEVEITNEGTATHTFTIDGQDVDIELDPGQSETVEVTIPETGDVPFFCRFHVSQGMQGAFFTSGS